MVLVFSHRRQYVHVYGNGQGGFKIHGILSIPLPSSSLKREGVNFPATGIQHQASHHFPHHDDNDWIKPPIRYFIFKNYLGHAVSLHSNKTPTKTLTIPNHIHKYFVALSLVFFLYCFIIFHLTLNNL